MKKQAVLYFFLLASTHLFSQTISLHIATPTQNQVIVDSILTINVTASSSAYEITGVTAAVLGRQTTLAFVSGQTFSGKISLSGLPSNQALVLHVNATAGPSEQKSDSVSFVFGYDPPPVLKLDSLLDGSNANPRIRIKALAVDNNTDSINLKISVIQQYGTSPVSNANFHNPIDSLFDLAALEGKTIYLVFTATDASGKTDRDTATITVESSPYLQKVFTADGKIVDFHYNKLLTYKGTAINITDITTHENVRVPYVVRPFNINPPPGQSLLTPYGAIINEYTIEHSDDTARVFDWNNNSLTLLGRITSSIKHAGKYVSWSTGQYSNAQQNLIRRDLSTQMDTIVSTYATPDFDLAVNGNMAFSNYDYNMVRYVNNIAGILTTDGGTNVAPSFWNSGPLTDGRNIIFSKIERKVYERTVASIYLWDGIKMREVSNLDDEDSVGYPRRLADYQVNNGFVAFVRKGPTGVRQIWFRDSSGVDHQQTFSNVNSSIDLLGPNGEMTIMRGGRRILQNVPGMPPTDISSALGKVYYRDSAWYLTLGHSLYQVDVAGLTNTYATIADGNWSNPAVWLNNTIPPAGARIVVKNNIIADQNVTCERIRVEEPGSLIVKTGITLTVLHQ